MKRGNLCAIILPKRLWKWNGLKTFIIYYFFLEWKTQQWHSQNNKAQNTLHNDNMKRGSPKENFGCHISNKNPFDYSS